jgi:hypothetical protein
MFRDERETTGRGGETRIGGGENGSSPMTFMATPTCNPSGRFVLRSLEAGIGTFTMHDHRRRNTLSGALIRELLDALGQFSGPDVLAIILRADPGATVCSSISGELSTPSMVMPWARKSSSSRPVPQPTSRTGSPLALIAAQ